MKNGLLAIAVTAGVCLLGSTQAGATEYFHTSTIRNVYPLSDGDFVIVFDADSANCPAAGPYKYQYVKVGQNGVTSEGSKKIFAAALSAALARLTTDIAFDDSTTNCYINRLSFRTS